MIYLQQSLGIDLRDNTLRMVHLGRTFKGIVLIDYFLKKYPLHKQKGAEEELDPLCLDLRNFIRQRGIKSDQIVIGLPKEKVILKEITMPKVEEKELRSMLRYELERHTPYPAEDVIFDYHIIRQEESTFHLLVAIVKNDEVQHLCNLLESGQKTPPVVDITSIAGMNWLIGQNSIEENSLTGLIDIGERSIEFGILDGKQIKITRSLKRSNNNRLEDIFISETSDSLQKKGPEEDDLFSEMKEEEKNTLGKDIIQELNIALHALSNEDDLDNIIVTGADAYDSFVSEQISNQIEAKVHLPNPLKNITKENIPGKISSSLAIATGLATRGLEEQPVMINFLSEGKKIRKKRNYLAFAITFISIISILLIAWSSGLIYQKQLIISQLNDHLETLKPYVADVKEMANHIEKLEKELSGFESITETEISKMNLLKELTNILPSDTWLDRLNISNEGINIDGYSESPSNLIPLLEISPMLENVQFASSIRKLGPQKQRFKIKANIEIENYEKE